MGIRMPIYSFENTETGEEFDEMMSYDEKVQYLKDNPHIIAIITKAPGLVSGVNHSQKTDGGWNEMLSRIAEANPYSEVGERYGDKGITATKKRQAVKKYRKARDKAVGR